MGSIVGGVIEEFDSHKGLRVENKRAGFDGRPSSSGGALQSGEKVVDRERERKIGTASGKPKGNGRSHGRWSRIQGHVNEKIEDYTRLRSHKGSGLMEVVYMQLCESL
ncbi:hypothetical protein F0562_001498 [Nyssa sinensis]|uniref:Uncharacterized protein n=1 Tax=Nyssa sinensis TaxID=561372 RepID=A0A5J5C4Q2_9ASTE|nr:hypothetical protein F0562_001498 [Nyssa sinensis]